MGELDPAVRKVLEIAEPLAQSMGFEVLMIEEVAVQGLPTLRIVLDHVSPDRNISIDNCAEFSRALDPVLEVETNLRSQYRLEVSSPGLDRPLVSRDHFKEQLGNFVNLTTSHPIDGRRHFKGILKSLNVDDGKANILIEIDGREYLIPFDEIKKANLDYFLSEELKKNKNKPMRYRKKKG